MDQIPSNGSLLQPSAIWAACRFDSFNDFVAGHDPFRFRAQVPASIRSQLEVTHKLLLHSYFEYQFLDIALARAMQIVEMALRIRHKEIEGSEPTDRVSLNVLIKWAARKGLTEESEERTQLLRKIRNFVVHARAETLYGISIVPTIYSVVDFVNELYEDVELRARRKTIEQEVQEMLSTVISEGAILSIRGVRLIIFRVECIYCALKYGGYELHVGFLPIFNPTEREGKTDIPDPIFVAAKNYVVHDRAIEFADPAGHSVTLAAITDEVNRETYFKFLSGYKSNPLLKTVERLPFAERRRQIKRSLIIADDGRRHEADCMTT